MGPEDRDIPASRESHFVGKRSDLDLIDQNGASRKSNFVGKRSDLDLIDQNGASLKSHFVGKRSDLDLIYQNGASRKSNFVGKRSDLDLIYQNGASTRARMRAASDLRILGEIAASPTLPIAVASQWGGPDRGAASPRACMGKAALLPWHVPRAASHVSRVAPSSQRSWRFARAASRSACVA
jgi:hypothetical protein